MSLIPKHRVWPTIIITVLLGNLALGVVLYRVANDDTHAAVEPDYYRKALAWDATQAQAARNAALGWRVDASLPPLAPTGPTMLTLEVRDAAGAPLTAPVATLEARQVAHADEVVTASATGDATPGEVRIPLALGREGLWELRLTIDRGADRFTEQLRLDVSRDAEATVVRARPGDPLPSRVAAGTAPAP